MTGATCEAGSSYPSGAPEITPISGGVRVAQSLVFYVVLCVHFFFNHGVVSLFSSYAFKYSFSIYCLTFSDKIVNSSTIL